MPPQRSTRRRQNQNASINAASAQRLAQPSAVFFEQGPAHAPKIEKAGGDPTSFCFADAHEALSQGQISEEAYLKSITAHCIGVRHGRNRLCNNDTDTKRPASNVTPRTQGFFLCCVAVWIRNAFYSNENAVGGKKPRARNRECLQC